MLSNSQTSDFLKPLYQKYFDEGEVEVVKAARAISSKAGGRGEIEEVVIMNYHAQTKRQTRMDKY